MKSLRHLDAHQKSENDVEKWAEVKSAKINDAANTSSDNNIPRATNTTSSLGSSTQQYIPPGPALRGHLANWNAKVESFAGLEARGIACVLPEEKHGGGRRGYLQMLALWFSMDLVVLNIIPGFLGPLVFQLGWVDSVCIVIFANALSSCGPAYISTFGPESGNRTMVGVRMEYMPQTR